MNYLLLSCALLATSAPAISGPPPTTKLAVYFSHHTTFDQLAAAKQSVLKDELMLEYDRLEFDASGHLVEISFHVEYRGEILGRASSDHLTDDSTFGFLKDFTPGAAKPFRIGDLK